MEKRPRARDATPNCRLYLPNYLRWISILACISGIASVVCVPSAYAWDSATHRTIARLAINALSTSALKITLAQHEAEVEQHAVEPDSVLKDRFGEAEERRHYINVEWFGADPWPSLNPSIRVMRRRFGDRTIDRAGTLPWTIEEVAGQLETAWRRGDCDGVLLFSGYLAHYVGDASQPLHSTIHYDGYVGDRGIHARLELAVDHSLNVLEPAAAEQVRIERINDVWTPAIAEIRDANGLIGEVIRDDRSARDQGDYRGRDYQRAMLRADAAMFARQIARASSVLASIWVYEWERANSPVLCASR